MRLAGIDLNLLVVLDALLRERGVTAASRRVGLSQSATSHALARLRVLLEDPILLRTTTGMVPTARAEVLTPVVRRILEESESVFFGEEGFDPSSSREVFSAALDESAQRTVLPRLIERIQRLAPGVQVVVPAGARPETLLRDFERGNVDVAISSHHPVEARDLHSRFLISADYVSITRKDHPIVGSRLSLSRFVELGHVTVTHPNLADIAIDNTLAELSKERRVVLTVREPAAVAAIVSRSDLVATLPRMLIDVGGAPANLTYHRPPIRLEPVPVFMIHHERTQGSAPHQWFRNQIVEVFTELSQEALRKKS